MRLSNFGGSNHDKIAIRTRSGARRCGRPLWVKILIGPPVTLEATEQGLDINQLVLSTPKDLPSFDDKYQRHLGVLDVLNAP